MRRKGREAALQILFQLDAAKVLAADQSAEAREEACKEAIAEYWQNFNDDAKVDRAFAESIVLGVTKGLDEIHTAIAKAAEHWRIERMEMVDRNVLRLAAYELLHCPEIPKNVSINEALEVTKRFSGEASVAFVNGILDKLAAL